MNQPWYLVGIGALFALLGGLLTVAALTSETPALLWVGWTTGGLGTAALFVGLIALGVEVGVRGAWR